MLGSIASLGSAIQLRWFDSRGALQAPDPLHGEPRNYILHDDPDRAWVKE